MCNLVAFIAFITFGLNAVKGLPSLVYLFCHVFIDSACGEEVRENQDIRVEAERIK